MLSAPGYEIYKKYIQIYHGKRAKINEFIIADKQY